MAPPRRSNRLLNDPTLLADAYRSGPSIAVLADRIGVSGATVRRALIRHGIARLPRNRNRRPASARVLDDGRWLADRYQTHTAVEIASELGVSSRTVYGAMDRHGIVRRATPGKLRLRRPELADPDWLHDAVERQSSTAAAVELEVSAGTVTTAYRRVGIDPASTTRLYARGRPLKRLSADALQAAWNVEGTYRGVGRQIGVTPSTARVWLAEVGVYLNTTAALSRTALLTAIDDGWPMRRIAAEHGLSLTTVRVELHRHGLFVAHRNRHRSRQHDAAQQVARPRRE